MIVAIKFVKPIRAMMTIRTVDFGGRLEIIRFQAARGVILIHLSHRSF